MCGTATRKAVLVLAVIRRSTDQHKMPVAIAAIDKALLINLKPDTGMAQSGGNFSAAVARDTRLAHSDSFRIAVVHLRRLAKPEPGCNGSEIVECDCPGA